MTEPPALIGRAFELDRIASLLAGIGDHGATLVVRGDAGMGKSSLLHAAATTARSLDLTVLRITGVEVESAMPYAGLHRLLSPLLDDLAHLPAVQQHALATALGIGDGTAPQVFLVALATLTLLTESAASRPVVLVIDDVQWLDAPTSEALAFVARRVAADPVVVVCALRNGHPSLWWESGFDELELEGLDDDEARRLLDERATDLRRSDRELVLRQAAGNPLALVELPVARHAVRHLPPGGTASFLPLSARLERAFAARLGEVPPATRDVLLVAAVDHEDDLGEVLAAAGVLAGHPMSVEALEPAVEVGLLRFDERRFGFRHPLVRSGILQAETTHRRQRAHAALAAVLATQPYRRTWHRSLAIPGPDDDVADELEATCAESMRRGWVGAAISALERSAELTTDSARRGRRLLLAAEYGFGLGRADLVDRLVSAAEHTQLSELDRARVEWLREIFSDGVPGDAGRVLELCATARRSAAAGDPDLALNLLLGAALRCWWAETGPAARARVAAEVDALAGHRRDPRHLAALAVAEPLLRGTEVVDRLSGIHVEAVRDPNALRLLGMAAHAVGDQVRAAQLLDRAGTRLRAQGRLGLLSHVLGMHSAVAVDLGDWARSAVAAQEGRQVAADTGQPVWSTGHLVNEARVSALRGESARALDLAAQADHSATLRALNDFRACAQLARGFAFITSARYAEAYAALARVFDPADPCHHPREALGGVMFLAEAAVHCGRVEDARAVLASMERLGKVTASPLLHMNLLYARPVLADDRRAGALYRQSLAADLSQWPWHRARIQHAYGSWLRRQRHVAQSRDPLRSALAAFEAMGAHTWAEQARTELRAAGERLEPRARTIAATTLSPQELQIARLAARGHSNREIAQQLFLSPRTVGSHLYRIFPKLDVTSRAQLASRLDHV